jgi:hypothetical protein
MKRDGPMIPNAVHGHLGITYHPNEKAKAVVDCLEKQFTSHDLRDENHERHVKTTVQALLESADDTLLGKARSCDINKLANSLKLGKSCGLDSIPNECLRHLPRRPLVHLTHCIQQASYSRFFFLKIVQRHIEERALLNASQFGFRARHSTTLQYMRLTDHVTLNFNNNISMAAVLLDIEKVFDKTWHPGLLYI